MSEDTYKFSDEMKVDYQSIEHSKTVYNKFGEIEPCYQVHRQSMSSFCTSRFTLILLGHSIEQARGGQSAAPMSNFGSTTQLFMTHLCMKIP